MERSFSVKGQKSMSLYSSNSSSKMIVHVLCTVHAHGATRSLIQSLKMRLNQLTITLSSTDIINHTHFGIDSQ